MTTNDSTARGVQKILEWRFTRGLELLLAFLGIVLTVYHIWEGVFAEGKALSASYKITLLAEGSEDFSIKNYVRPELNDYVRIVDLGIILWNSGSQIVNHGDIRGEDQTIGIEIELGSSSQLMENGWKLTRQMTSIQNNFNLLSQGNNRFTLTWQALDPRDFVQAHFLIATKLEKERIDNIRPNFTGSVTGTKGNVAVDATPYTSKQRLRAFIFTLISCVILLLAGRAFLKAFPQPPAFLRNLKETYQLPAMIVFILIAVSAFAAISVGIAGGVAYYMTSVPDWSTLSIYSIREDLKVPPF
jgi:hypothetical protein